MNGNGKLNGAGRIPRLGRVDLDAKLTRKAYDAKLVKLQLQLTKIQQAYLFSGDSAVIVFEGWDAAGKGGTIRRMSVALDPRSFKVWPIAAPRNYYLERHFLTRFFERLPPRGAISAFDRSWYGRVLVERVEGFTPKERWKAGYREINQFERMLVENGTRVIKLFFHISPEEQLRRFEERLRDPLKRWKLSYEDFRNRAKWQAYENAVDDMFERTSTSRAPWYAIPFEDKRYGRIAALTTIVRRLKAGVDLSPPTLDDSVLEAAVEHMQLPHAELRRLSGRTE
ncbi:MAG: polyphosphate kinase [Geminicoccaceae bacterium]|nr:MAG: polyphosphate kinase [Geminicoccaceae bacterium]